MSLKKTILIAGVLVSGLTGFAAEKTGKELGELIRDMNKELTTAKVEVQKIESEYRAKHSEPQKEMLPKRKEALEDLQNLTENMKETEDPAKRKELEAKVNEQVLKVGEVSADFIENHKDELLNQDRQLAVMEKALGQVILKLDKMTRLATSASAKEHEKQMAEKLVARRELREMARVIEVFAKKNPNSRRWKGVRQTIMLQDAILKKNATGNSKLKDMLTAQKQAFEQTHAQIVIARHGLAQDRGLLSQLAIGEVAKTMLRRLASLLVGDVSIDNVGTAFLKTTEKRQSQLMSFIEQDDRLDSDDTDRLVSDDMPEGYDALLNAEIN